MLQELRIGKTTIVYRKFDSCPRYLAGKQWSFEVTNQNNNKKFRCCDWVVWLVSGFETLFHPHGVKSSVGGPFSMFLIWLKKLVKLYDVVSGFISPIKVIAGTYWSDDWRLHVQNRMSGRIRPPNGQLP